MVFYPVHLWQSRTLRFITIQKIQCSKYITKIQEENYSEQIPSDHIIDDQLDRVTSQKSVKHGQRFRVFVLWSGVTSTLQKIINFLCLVLILHYEIKDKIESINYLSSCLYSHVSQPEVIIHELHLVSAEQVRKFEAIEHF